MKEFSFFGGGATHTKNPKNTNIAQVADYIQNNEQLKKLTQKYRNILDITIKKEEKKKLPTVVFAGTFRNRTKEEIIKFSGYICADLDHINSIEEIRRIQKLITEHYKPALMFISPSEQGLKAIFSINIDEGMYEEYFDSLALFFKEKINFEIDSAYRNYSQTCFLIHDPNVFYNDNPYTLDRSFISKYRPIKEAIINADRFDSLVTWTEKQVVFKKGHRNIYITRLAGACNRFGILMSDTLNHCGKYASDDFTYKEIESVIRSVYRNTAFFGIAKNINDLDGAADNPFIRVGTTFYKIIKKPDRFNVLRDELKTWNKDTILQDHKRKFLYSIPRYDEFIMYPDNLNYQRVINNCYNMYAPFTHTPAPGDWTWSQYLMEHVFGEQYPLGLRYMQILYLHPDHSTVILVLVSKERGTGKTTFINWLNMIFGANVAVVTPSDFASGFNGLYGTKNIICIEETIIERKLTIEKLKDLATAKNIPINEKYISPYKLPFYGKIILTSNNETRFTSIDMEEIRFFVRKLGKPIHTNHSIEDNLLQEIPAFLYYLQSLPPVDWTVSRSGFIVEELHNDTLEAVKQESHSGLYKDLEIYLGEYFANNNADTLFASASDLKNRFFPYNNNITASYISRVLKDEFNIRPDWNHRYYPFAEDSLATSKMGRPFRFYRKDFIDDEDEKLPY